MRQQSYPKASSPSFGDCLNSPFPPLFVPNPVDALPSKRANRQNQAQAFYLFDYQLGPSPNGFHQLTIAAEGSDSRPNVSFWRKTAPIFCPPPISHAYKMSDNYDYRTFYPPKMSDK